MPSPEAIVLASQVLEMDSVRRFLAKHDIWRTRELKVIPDQVYQGYYKIPLLDRRGEGWYNLFRPQKNPKAELKKRLQHLVQNRRGYQPGDIFLSPWGRFLVTDVLGIKEI